MHFELVSPEKLEYAVEAEMVVVPGREGDMGILNNHSPLISSLRPGMLEIHVSDREKPDLRDCSLHPFNTPVYIIFFLARRTLSDV